MTVDAAVSTEAPAAYLERYGLMLLIRQFETEMQRLFLKGEVHGTTHLCAGQEAVPVGVCSALEPDDYLAGTYRGHGHALAKGTDPDALIAEMLGRATGVCGGRAGSMNVIDVERGLVGCFGIVGGSIAAATGAALAGQAPGPGGGRDVRRRGDQPGVLPRVPELREGVLAASRVRVREQLLRGVHADDGGHRRPGHRRPRRRVRDPVRGRRRQRRVGGARAALEAVQRARAGEGPTLLECQTYRHHGHSKADPARYRPPEEVERWLARDPLTIARSRLLELGVAEPEIAEVEDATRARMDRAVEAALAAPYPDPQADGGNEFAP